MSVSVSLSSSLYLSCLLFIIYAFKVFYLGIDVSVSRYFSMSSLLYF